MLARENSKRRRIYKTVQLNVVETSFVTKSHGSMKMYHLDVVESQTSVVSASSLLFSTSRRRTFFSSDRFSPCLIGASVVARHVPPGSPATMCRSSQRCGSPRETSHSSPPSSGIFLAAERHWRGVLQSPPPRPFGTSPESAPVQSSGVLQQ